MNFPAQLKAREQRATIEVRDRCALLAHRQPNDEERAQLLAECYVSEGMTIGDLGECVEILALEDLICDAVAKSGDLHSSEYLNAAVRLGDFVVGLAREAAAKVLEREMSEARADYYTSLRRPDPDAERDARMAL